MFKLRYFIVREKHTSKTTHCLVVKKKGEK